jgi:hypothetical protein
MEPVMKFEQWREWGNPTVAAIVHKHPHLAGLARQLLAGPKFMSEVIAELRAATLRPGPASPHIPAQITAVPPSAPPPIVVSKTAAEETAHRRRAETILAIGAALGVPEAARMLAESSTSVEAAEQILLLCTPDRGWRLAQRRAAGEPALSPPPTAAEAGWLAAYARLKREQELLVRPHYRRADCGR